MVPPLRSLVCPFCVSSSCGSFLHSNCIIGDLLCKDGSWSHFTLRTCPRRRIPNSARHLAHALSIVASVCQILETLPAQDGGATLDVRRVELLLTSLFVVTTIFENLKLFGNIGIWDLRDKCFLPIMRALDRDTKVSESLRGFRSVLALVHGANQPWMSPVDYDEFAPCTSFPPHENTIS